MPRLHSTSCLLRCLLTALIVILNAAPIKSQSDNTTVVIEGQEATVDNIACAKADWRVKTQMLGSHGSIRYRAFTMYVHCAANQPVRGGNPSRPDQV